MTSFYQTGADDTQAIAEQESFIVTKEYRRFAEFCDACLREKYIGLCYGEPGVGKTLSARYYAKWYFLEKRLPTNLPYLPLHQDISNCRTLLYTAEITSTPRTIKDDIGSMRVQLGRFVEELLPKEQRTLMARDIPNYCHLIIVDETERLKMGGIEQFREIYDKNDIGLIFIGMPGLEKQLSRYPQLYSRIGFSHNYRTLSKEEMMATFSAFAQIEREYASSRTKKGLAKLKAQGKVLGRRSNFEQWKSKLIEMQQLGYSAYGISQETELCYSTVKKYLRQLELEI